MKLPLSWLREFITIEGDTADLCHRLTMAGLEVEAVEQLAPAFTDVFVAKVLGVERHPNADRLSVCDVDAGPVGKFRVVCGAPNVHPGMMGALAKVGARLGGGVHGQGSGSLEDAVPLQAALIRGVQSEGMLCSEMELGLSRDHEGIVELDSDSEARIGEDLRSYLQLPDTLLDIAITPNRGDCLSILGLAREIAALFGVRCNLPRFRPAKTPPSEGEGRVSLDVEIAAPDLCPRYAALAMSNVKPGAAPVWMRRRLELCGMRPVSNVVDVTNYVMLELGQPLHAFDLTQIADRAIVVRRAGQDREFETLDGIRRNLEPDDLLIADRGKPLAIGGVMGGRNSEVSSSTASIVLESAYFEPMTIAKTARRLGLRSEASYRFERGIDRAVQVSALLRAAELIRAIAGGKESSAIIDVEPRPRAERRIEVSVDSLNALLGVNLQAAEIKRRFKGLGMIVEAAGRNRLTVTAPSFRPDINEPADLAEEVARLPGLTEIPAALPSRSAAAGARNTGRLFVKRMREAMIGCGMAEANTIAFVAPAENERYPGFFNERAPYSAAPVKVVNPLSAELSELRLSLVSGLLQALRFNLHREANSFHAFEIGKVFRMVEASAGATASQPSGFEQPRAFPGENQRIAAVSYGNYAMGGVNHRAIQASFFTVKGILEACVPVVGVRQEVTFEPLPPSMAPYLHPGRSALISCEGAVLGVLGELHPAEAIRLELDGACVALELDLSKLMAYSTAQVPAVEAPPKFPAIRRDLALVLDLDFPSARVVRTISDLNAPWLESVELFDVYQGESIPAGKKSVALACRYRSKDRTLTDEEVNRAHSLLVEQAKAQLGAELRL